MKRFVAIIILSIFALSNIFFVSSALALKDGDKGNCSGSNPSKNCMPRPNPAQKAEYKSGKSTTRVCVKGTDTCDYIYTTKDGYQRHIICQRGEATCTATIEGATKKCVNRTKSRGGRTKSRGGDKTGACNEYAYVDSATGKKIKNQGVAGASANATDAKKEKTDSVNFEGKSSAEINKSVQQQNAAANYNFDGAGKVTAMLGTMLIAIAGASAIMLYAVSAFMFITSGGSYQKAQKAKDLAMRVTIAIAAIASVYIIKQISFELFRALLK